jgi:hypothetical protein
VTISSDRSIDLLLAAQTDVGAIPASTVHDIYQYGWLRDGSWCAYALDRAGHTSAAAAWHEWVARTLLAHRERVDEAIRAVRNGAVTGRVMMPARFTLAGEEESPGDSEQEWPNFQTDCYGFWLWTLADHVRRGGLLDDTKSAAARLVVDYLLVAGETPCFDCWEEHPGNVHTSSLAAVAAGLRDAGALLDDPRALAYAEHLTARMTGPDHTLAGTFVRFPGDTRVDGSLLWLAVPFGLIGVDHPTFRLGPPRIRSERTSSTHAHLDRGSRNPRGLPARAGADPRAIPVHAGLLEAEVGRHGHTPPLVARHALDLGRATAAARLNNAHSYAADMDGSILRVVRKLSLLAWLGVLVVALLGVLLYLAGGMYLGIVLVFVAALGAVGVVAFHLTPKPSPGDRSYAADMSTVLPMSCRLSSRRWRSLVRVMGR